MEFFNQFERFDPLQGEIPAHGKLFQLPIIASRARRLLISRTMEQMEAAANGIGWAIDEYFTDAKRRAAGAFREKCDASITHGIADEYFPVDDYLDIPTAENTTEVDALRMCEDWWADIGYKSFPGGKPYELFAVLSLWMVADALTWLKCWENEKPLDRNDIGANQNILLTCKYALMAMDAVCCAEQLQALAQLEAHAIEQTAKRNFIQKIKRDDKSRAQAELNQHRHRKTAEIKSKAIEKWNKSRSLYSSAEKAGTAISISLGLEGFQCEPRTVAGWLRAHAKEIGVTWR